MFQGKYMIFYFSPRIHVIITRFFIATILVGLVTILLAGFYFNKIDENDKRKNNISKTHALLSHLIIPSIIISDSSEVRRLLYMASSNVEKYIVMENKNVVIMPDYADVKFLNYISKITDFSFCDKHTVVYGKINGKKYLINCSVLQNTDELIQHKKLGFLLSFTSYDIFTFSPTIFYLIAVLFVMLVFITAYFRKVLDKKLLAPLLALKNGMTDVSICSPVNNKFIDELECVPKELMEIKNVFEMLLRNTYLEYVKRVEAEKEKVLIDLAASVAHDIRSPLAALEMVIKDIQNIHEEQRLIIRHATNRISDIANNLLSQYKQNKHVDLLDENEHVRPVLISNLLMSVISEKRAQYINLPLSIIFNASNEAYGKFANISASTFTRVISNLIDNAVEAESNELILTLCYIKQDNFLSIDVLDNGKGMSDDIRNKILQGEYVTTKNHGHGLGLQHAVKTVTELWNGFFDIKSGMHSGTIINILLPGVSAPQWFLSELFVDVKCRIVIVDDDESIHQIWRKRFGEINSTFRLIHLYSPEDLLGWTQDNITISCVFLIDYEFIGSISSGLCLINDLGIAASSYLVTSRYDDLDLCDYSEKAGLKVIPKSYAIHIPIYLINHSYGETSNIVFIDDDKSLTYAWKLYAATKGISIATYNSTSDFCQDMGLFHLNTCIYIDYDLNESISGQDFAKKLYEIGFRDIYLTTGYRDLVFPEMYWIKKVIGKSPPF